MPLGAMVHLFTPGTEAVSAAGAVATTGGLGPLEDTGTVKYFIAACRTFMFGSFSTVKYL